MTGIGNDFAAEVTQANEFLRLPKQSVEEEVVAGILKARNHVEGGSCWSIYMSSVCVALLWVAKQRLQIHVAVSHVEEMLFSTTNSCPIACFML